MKIMSGRFSTDRDSDKFIFGLGAALALMLVCLLIVSYLIGRDGKYDKEYVSYAGDLRVLSQEIAKNATEAVAGKEEAFDQLKRSRNDFCSIALIHSRRQRRNGPPLLRTT